MKNTTSKPAAATPKASESPAFTSAVKQNDKELLATLLSQPAHTRGVLTRVLDDCEFGEFISFANPDNKKLTNRVNVYNSNHADRHFLLRKHNLTTYAVRVEKPAPRKGKALRSSSDQAAVSALAALDQEAMLSR